MDKNLYDQTVINFHSQMMLQKLTNPRDFTTPRDTDKIMDAFLEDFNRTLAQPFLNQLAKTKVEFAALRDVYPEYFLNSKAGTEFLKDMCFWKISEFELGIAQSYEAVKERQKVSDITSLVHTTVKTFAGNILECARYDVNLAHEMIHIAQGYNTRFNAGMKQTIEFFYPEGLGQAIAKDYDNSLLSLCKQYPELPDMIELARLSPHIQKIAQNSNMKISSP